MVNGKNHPEDEVVKIILKVPADHPWLVNLDRIRGHMRELSGEDIPREWATVLLADLGMVVAGVKGRGGSPKEIFDTIAEVVGEWKGFDAEHTPEG